MYARVAKFEDVETGRIDEIVEQIGKESGPPPGVPGKRFLMLGDREGGKTLAIGFFETEEDLRTGDATLNAMDVPGPEKRTSVEMYEVLLELSA